MHDGRIVIDGLVFHSDGDAGDLLAGAVDAVNLTVSDVFADAGRALDDLSAWRARASAPGSAWRLVLDAADIREAAHRGQVGLIMGWQDSRPIGEDLQRMASFHALGLRVIQLTYNYANHWGDGCLEKRNAGLTEHGRQAIAEMDRLGIAIDVSHCGQQTSLEAALASRRPVLATHSGARAVADRVRNKNDEVIRAIAERGGVVGCSLHGFMNWTGDPLRPPSVDLFVRHVRHVADVGGWDCVGVGNDFACVSSPEVTRSILEMSRDRMAGATGDFIRAFGNTLEKRYPDEINNPRHWRRITERLLGAGIAESQVEKVIGGNLLRAFGDAWSG